MRRFLKDMGWQETFTINALGKACSSYCVRGKESQLYLFQCKQDIIEIRYVSPNLQLVSLNFLQYPPLGKGCHSNGGLRGIRYM